jgi:transcriptional regulator with XRE-family HTH domain
MDLKDYQTKNKLSQAQLAKKLGVSPACISLFLSGKRRAGLDLIDKAYEATGGAVTANDLLGHKPLTDPGAGG